MSLLSFMPPKPGNAFAQQKEMERQTSQRQQQHARDLSHDTNSSASTVRLNLPRVPQQPLPADEPAQDFPDSPRTTMAMFTEDDAPEKRQDVSQDLAPLSKKEARKQKKKVETKRPSSVLQESPPTRSSAMPEPLFSEKQSGFGLIKSTFAKGKKAFAKTAPIPTPQPEKASTPFNPQQRQGGSEQPARPQIHAAASELQNTDPAVLYATVKASPQSNQPAVHVSAAAAASSSQPARQTTHVSTAPSHARAAATTSQQPADLNIHALATTPQHTGNPYHHGPVSGPQKPGPLARYASGTASQQAIPSSGQNSQSEIPDRYKTSTAHDQRNSNLPLFEPYTGMMPYSHLFPPRHDRQGHLSAGTQQTYATTQSQYAAANENEGIILGHAALSPTRQGSYATAGNAELVSRPSVNSMAGIVSQISPTSQAPQEQALRYNGPFPLSSLPASVAEDQARYRSRNTSSDAPSTSNFQGSIQAGHKNGITGTWERMQAQYPQSMPQISPLPQEPISQPMSCDPTYILSCHGVVPLASLYNLNASEDTRSEGQKSDVEAAELADDSDTEIQHFDHVTGTVKRLLHKSGFRGAFSNEDLRNIHRNFTPDAEAPVFGGSFGEMQYAVLPQDSLTIHNITGAAQSNDEEEDGSMVGPMARSTEGMLSPDVPQYIQTVAASAGPISANMPRNGGQASHTTLRASNPAPFGAASQGRFQHKFQQKQQQQQHRPQPKQQQQKQRDSRPLINTTTFGGPSPTPPHPAYIPAAPLSQQIASAFTILHHRLDREHRLLREHVSSTTETGRDALMAHLELQMSRIRMDLAEGMGRFGERMRGLEGEVAALRRELARGRGGGGAPPASGSRGFPSGAALSVLPPHVPTPAGRAGAARVGRRREEEGRREGEEVLWRRPTAGRVGDIGGRWYGEEVRE